MLYKELRLTRVFLERDKPTTCKEADNPIRLHTPLHVRKYEKDNAIGWRSHLHTPQCLHGTTGREKVDRNKRRPTRIKDMTGLAWPRISIQGNILLPMINPNQKGPHKEKIPQDTCINEDLPYKERSSPSRNECQLYFTIKTLKLSQAKVRIIYSSSGTLELWKFSNLTFGGYLVGTTLVLFVRSSFFLFHRFYLEHVRIVRLTDDFWHH